MLPTKATPATSLSQLYHRSTPIAPAQSHSLDHRMYQTTEKVFMKSLYIIEESSLSHPHPFRLSKKHTKNAAIMLVCLGFFILWGQRFSKLPCYLPSIFMSVIFDQFPQN